MEKSRIVKLGEVCDFQGGSQPPKEEWIAEFKPGYVRMLQIRDFTQSRNFAPEYVLKSKKNKLCEKNDVLIGRYGASVGKILTGLAGAYNVALLKAMPDEKIVLKPYLKRYFQSDYFQSFLKNVCESRAAQAGFSKEDIYDCSFPLLSITKQKLIGDILDKVDKIIEFQKKRLEELDSLVQSVFYKMFGDPVENIMSWRVEQLKKMTLKIGAGATPKGGNENYKLVGIPLIRSLNVYNGIFQYKNLAFIDEKQALALNNVIVNKDDVLLNITGASVARSCIVPEHLVPARVNQHVAIIRVKNEFLNSIYLCALFTSSSYQKKLLNLSKSNGATREALTKSDLEKLPIPLPPLSLQLRFAVIIEKIEQQKELVKKALQESEDLFQRLMQDLFRSEQENGK